MSSFEEPSVYGPAMTPAPSDAFGGEVAGPAFTELAYEFRRAAEGLERLYAQARAEVRRRYLPITAQLQTDASGNGRVKLYEVPQGATGFLTWLSADEAGVTPATPDTRATLWHAIAAGQPGDATQAQLIATGALLDFQPASVAADAQLPAVYTYGSEYAGLCLIGPGSFYFVVAAANASVLVKVRCGVFVEMPEP